MNLSKSCVFWMALGLPANAVAQSEALEKLIETVDANKNGSVERTEFAGSDEQFREIDKDNDKRLSKVELANSALVKRMLGQLGRDAQAPRARTEPDLLALRRLESLRRFDSNQDGRITRAEWQGEAVAFRELDVDDDGSLDGKDRDALRKRLADRGQDAVEATLPEMKSAFESSDELLRRHDDDKDGTLTRPELRAHRLALAFDWADRDHDGRLDRRELDRVVNEVARRVMERDSGDSRKSAYRVPFSSWDKNNDGRLEVGEWQGNAYLFPRIDSDRDALLSSAEVLRYVRSVEGRSFIERFDLDDDGRVTQGEFDGPVDAFRRFDRNQDGGVTSSDR